MQGTHSFLIQAKPPLRDVLVHESRFKAYWADDVILRVDLTDRHGIRSEKIYEAIKATYLKSARKALPEIDETLGFDHYWSFEKSKTGVVAFVDVLGELDLTEPCTGVEALDYLIQVHQRVQD